MRPRDITGMTETQEGVAEWFDRVSGVYDETREPLSDSALDKIVQVLSPGNAGGRDTLLFERGIHVTSRYDLFDFNCTNLIST